MKLKALKSFGGKISMYAGEVKDVLDEFIVKDLIRAGYAEPYAQEAEIVEKPVEKSRPTTEQFSPARPKKVAISKMEKPTKKKKK